jgi:alpha-glucosidase
VWVDTDSRRAKYLRHAELHLAFNFSHLGSQWDANDMRTRISGSLSEDLAVGAPTTWVLENHDVPRVVTRYAGGELPSGNAGSEDEPGGLRRLLPLTATQFEVGTRRARAGNIFMLALPGSAYIYNGQELGLFEVVDLPDEVRQDPVWFRTNGTVVGRDGCRVPMPWNASAPAHGFGPTDSEQSWLPQPAQWANLSVDAQQGVDGSMLELVRQAIGVRKSHGAFGETALTWRDDLAAHIAPNRDDVLAIELIGPQDAKALVVLVVGSESVLRPQGELLVSSQPLTDMEIPGETCAWFDLN